MGRVLALFGNFDFTELLVIGVGALLVFGRRLPEVAMRAAAQLVRLRRAVAQMWREAGIEDELRRVRREIEREVPPRRATQRVLSEPAREPEREPAPEPERAEGPSEAPTEVAVEGDERESA